MNSQQNWNTQPYPMDSFKESYSSSFKAQSSQRQNPLFGSEPRQSIRKNKSLLGRSQNDIDDRPEDRDAQMKNTSGKLMRTNFSHHDPQLCVCESCTCGRHLCKLHNVYPNLSKASVYRQSYPKKCPIPNIVNRPGEYMKLQGPHIGMDTNYLQDFMPRKGDLTERRLPEDLLKTGGGPSNNLTSYSSGFPGHKCCNQYVKPSKQLVRGKIPIRARSTYTNSFPTKPVTKPVTEKIPDNLKTNNLWLGKSTYGNFFGQPNPQDYSHQVKNTPRRDDILKFNRQFETTYKNSFIPQEITVCPAKILLETRSKGAFLSSKERFNENSDFKAFDPAFHTISMSKHSFV